MSKFTNFAELSWSAASISGGFGKNKDFERPEKYIPPWLKPRSIQSTQVAQLKRLVRTSLGG
jgi:hypothetical protein